MLRVNMLRVNILILNMSQSWVACNMCLNMSRPTCSMRHDWYNVFDATCSIRSTQHFESQHVENHDLKIQHIKCQHADTQHVTKLSGTQHVQCNMFDATFSMQNVWSIMFDATYWIRSEYWIRSTQHVASHVWESPCLDPTYWETTCWYSACPKVEWRISQHVDRATCVST